MGKGSAATLAGRMLSAFFSLGTDADRQKQLHASPGPRFSLPSRSKKRRIADLLERPADHPRHDDAQQASLRDLVDDGGGGLLRRIVQHLDVERVEIDAVAMKRIDRRHGISAGATSGRRGRLNSGPNHQATAARLPLRDQTRSASSRLWTRLDADVGGLMRSRSTTSTTIAYRRPSRTPRPCRDRAR